VTPPDPGPSPQPLLRPLPSHRLPRERDGRIDVDRLLARIGPADLLEDAPDGWAVLVPHDGPTLVDDGHRARWWDDDGVHDLGDDPFAAIDRIATWCGVRPAASVDPALPPFTGGLVGAWSYDLARRVERLPSLAPARREPMLHLRLADLAVVVRPGREDAAVVGRDLTRRGRVDARAAALAERATSAGDPSGASSLPPSPATGPIRSSLPRPRYLAAVETILGHIAAGDAFQVNLTQQLRSPWSGDALALYRRLRAASPAPHGACLPGLGIASVSPETFLDVTSGRVLTRPIKGTRPRVDDPALDAAMADDLATSTKDRAENVMVVDLERNDLGRVCVPGTVRVPELTALERHPTVWHLVSTVEGRLRADVGYGGLLRATFPCGSITGAPKVSAMSIVERLEPVRRGWYCGAVGFLSPGRAHLSVAIRTAVVAGGEARYGAGGGIVADSDPVAEHDESLAKAAAFLAAVGASPSRTPDELLLGGRP
jgi:para-aminobenzoate synthetase component 1